MTGWIKLDKKLRDSIRFRRVVRKVRDSNALRRVTDEQRSVSDALYETLVLGALMRLWAYADTHINNDNTLDMTLDEIDDLVGVDGFGQALPADWLQVLDPNRVQLPDFLAHNGGSEKQRRDNARRQAQYRHRRDSRNVTRDVTGGNARNDARPEEIRPDQKDTHNTRARARGTTQSESTHHAEFEKLKAAYPPFSGRQNWLQAEHYCRVRIDTDGLSWEDLHQAVERYAAYVEQGGVSSTGHVLTPATFFSAPDKPWLQQWPPPVAKPRAMPKPAPFVAPPDDPLEAGSHA